MTLSGKPEKYDRYFFTLRPKIEEAEKELEKWLAIQQIPIGDVVVIEPIIRIEAQKIKGKWRDGPRRAFAGFKDQRGERDTSNS